MTMKREKKMSWNRYEPDGWAIVKTSEAYFIFGSFDGSFTTSDNWRRNSGISSYEEEEHFHLFHGFSGSTYACRKKHNRMNMYCQGVLNAMLEANEGAEVISVKDFLKEFDNEEI